jgi:hypothetical protein
LHFCFFILSNDRSEVSVDRNVKCFHVSGSNLPIFFVVIISDTEDGRVPKIGLTSNFEKSIDISALSKGNKINYSDPCPPVEPKPPAPRIVSSRSCSRVQKVLSRRAASLIMEAVTLTATSSTSGVSIFSIISCAIRSPSWTVQY